MRQINPKRRNDRISGLSPRTSRTKADELSRRGGISY
jgi:hypothetical protein